MSVSSIPLHRLEETYDLVIANLTAPVITQMAANLCRCVSPEGWLVLSGILNEQMEEVVKSFQAHYFKEVDSWTMEEWGAILLRRKELAKRMEHRAKFQKPGDWSQQPVRRDGILEQWNNGKNHTNAGYSSWFPLTQHSIIPVFQHSQSAQLILLDSNC